MWYSPSLQQLLFLEAVLEEGNFVRAADRLHTTHSTISSGLSFSAATPDSAMAMKSFTGARI